MNVCVGFKIGDRDRNNFEMNLWNVGDLPMPPINTYKAPSQDVDIKQLQEVCKDLKFFFDNKYMYAESLVLSRLIYRMKQKFRSAKDFKALEKLNKALENFFKVGILNVVNTFMDLLPSRYTNETYLPTKSMLDYLLVRLQGIAKLMERIVETCKISAFLSNMRIKTGHMWRVAFMGFALVSRVYILAKYNAFCICEFYGKLLPFSSQLQNSGKTWLPEEYILPKDLKEWMNVDWLDFEDEIQITEMPIEVPDIMEYFDLVDNDDDIEFCNEYVIIDDELEESFRDLRKAPRMKNEESSKGLRGFSLHEDVGEIIEIDDVPKPVPDDEVLEKERDVIYLSDSSVDQDDNKKNDVADEHPQKEKIESDSDEVIIVSCDETLQKKKSKENKRIKIKAKKNKERKNKGNKGKMNKDKVDIPDVKKSVDAIESLNEASKQAKIKLKKNKLNKNDSVTDDAVASNTTNKRKSNNDTTSISKKIKLESDGSEISLIQKGIPVLNSANNNICKTVDLTNEQKHEKKASLNTSKNKLKKKKNKKKLSV